MYKGTKGEYKIKNSEKNSIFQFPVSDYQPPTANCELRTTNYELPTANLFSLSL